jgi:ABC-2 type transport system ATP-binding protein
MNNNAIETTALRKVYRGRPVGHMASWTEALGHTIKNLIKGEVKVALDNINLKVKSGDLFGVIGSNGAGKTTLLKLLSCLLFPDGGTARVNGFDIRKQRSEVRRSVMVIKTQGWLGLLWQLTGRQNLLFQAKMCGLPGAEAKRRVDRTLEMLEIENKANDYSWNWSAGEQQKFNLALSFVTPTPVVLFDEPTAHLDPHIAGQVRRFIKERVNGENGQTVVMSSHYLEEADFLCDRVAILDEGKLIACDSPAALKRQYCDRGIHEIWVENYSSDLGDTIKNEVNVREILEHYEDPTAGRARLRVYWENRKPDIPSLLRALKRVNVKIRREKIAKASLDDVYFNLTKGKIT